MQVNSIVPEIKLIIDLFIHFISITIKSKNNFLSFMSVHSFKDERIDKSSANKQLTQKLQQNNKKMQI